MTYHFDSQAFVRRMEAAGMDRKVAEELADALGSGVLDGLATDRGLAEMRAGIEANLRELELRLKTESKDLELRLMTRVGAVAAASSALTITVLGALIAFLR